MASLTVNKLPLDMQFALIKQNEDGTGKEDSSASYYFPRPPCFSIHFLFFFSVALPCSPHLPLQLNTNYFIYNITHALPLRPIHL